MQKRDHVQQWAAGVPLVAWPPDRAQRCGWSSRSGSGSTSHASAASGDVTTQDQGAHEMGWQGHGRMAMEPTSQRHLPVHSTVVHSLDLGRVRSLVLGDPCWDAKACRRQIRGNNVNLPKRGDQSLSTTPTCLGAPCHSRLAVSVRYSRLTRSIGGMSGI